MQKQTEIYMKQNHMTRPGDGVLVGLSGGADSVGLLLVLWKLRETFQISLRALHVHHGLRGAEADRDAAFSRMLCKRLEIPFMSSVSMRQKRRLTGNVPSRRRDDWHGTACMRRRRGRGRKRFGRFISPLPTMRMITRKRFFLTCSAEAV